MSAVLTTNEGEELRRLIPLNTLPEHRLEQLCSDLRIEEAPKGSILFHQGDATREFVYLLSGTISLQAGGVEMDSVIGGSDVSRFALAHQIPRKVSAVAQTRIRYVRINPDLINQRDESIPEPTDDQAIDVLEASDNDWMSSLLRSPIFQRLPPANLQALLRNIEEIEVKAGDVICRQDEDGDYFYIIKDGQCSLTRKPTPTAKEIRLATLKACDIFGEDALLSGKPRAVTITMDTDGQLLRLDKANFLKLVRDPVISRLSVEDALALVSRGGIWLDVRLPDHFQKGHPSGHCINAPFFSLRMMWPTLDREKNYVVVCEDGKISEAAAYLLLRFRFKAHVLKGGIVSLPAEALTEDPPAEPAPEGKAPESGAVSRPTGQPTGKAAEPLKPPAEAGASEPVGPLAGASSEAGSAAAPKRDPGRRDSHDLHHLEARLSRLMGEKEKADAELRQARQSIHQLEAALQSLQEDRERLLQERAEDTGVSELRSRPASEESLRQELEELKARHAEVLFEKESAEQEVQNLETEVGDLKATMEEFLEQGGFGSSEQAEALRAELEMVREQAGAELTTLQSLLGEAKAESTRLRGELQSLKTQLSVRDVAASVVAAEPAAVKPSLAARIGWALAAGALVAALALGGLFGLAPGRDLARSWLGDPAQPTETRS